MHEPAEVAYANDNDTPDAGLYTWDLATNTLYADSALAELFGLDAAETESGLPLEAYFERVDPADRPELAKAISNAIKSGQPFQESYCVLRGDGSPTRINAYGKCFRDRGGVPRLYAGIVFPMPASLSSDTDLRWLCVAARDRARKERRDDVAQLLQEALKTLDDARIVNEKAAAAAGSA